MNETSTNTHNPIYEFLTKANSNIEKPNISRNLYQLRQLPTLIHIPPTLPLTFFPSPEYPIPPLPLPLSWDNKLSK
jgi:hypothetical protein